MSGDTIQETGDSHIAAALVWNSINHGGCSIQLLKPRMEWAKAPNDEHDQ